jgi:hypothetical protein
MENQKVRNVIKNTHKNVKYVILADRKLNREEMLKQIRNYNYTSANIRPKMGSVIEIDYDENV